MNDMFSTFAILLSMIACIFAAAIFALCGYWVLKKVNSEMKKKLKLDKKSDNGNEVKPHERD